MKLSSRALSVVAATLALVVTSPGLPGTSWANSPAGDNVYQLPIGTARGNLVVFLPGTGYAPQEESVFLKRSASWGFHTLGLAYVNHDSVQSLCGSKDATCHGKVRREIVYGTNLTDRVNVSAANSVVGRLKTALQRQGFTDYLSSGEPVWSKIIVVGHSQGAGHAGILCIDKKLLRCGLIAGPNEQLRGRRLPEWIAAPGPNGTSPSSWYALRHGDDYNVKTQRKALDVFAVPVANRQTVAYGANDAHLSLALDDQLEPSASNPSTVLEAWKKLLGG